MEIEEGAKLKTDTESVKLFKMTRNYNWEIKILDINLERLAELNNKMLKQYGDSINGAS